MTYVLFFMLKWLTSAEEFRSLIALVGLNGQGVGTSVFSEWVKKITELNLPESEKQNLDLLVEQIYDDMDSGKLNKRSVIYIYTVFIYFFSLYCFKLFADFMFVYTHVFLIYILLLIV